MLDIDGGFRAGIVTPRTLATEDEGPKGMLPVTRALPARAESMDSKFFDFALCGRQVLPPLRRYVVRLRWLLAAGPLDHEWNSPPPLEENNSEEPLVPDGAMDAAMDAVDKEPRDGTNISASTPSRGCSTFPLWLFAIAASLHVWNTASRGQADGTNGQPRHNSYVFMLSKWYTC